MKQGKNSKIDGLEKKIRLIKENIEYCKKKQMKDLKKILKMKKLLK